MGTYLLQVICFQALFLAVYYVLLKKETFFIYNRIYLLVTPLLSLVIPFIKFTTLQTIVPVEVIATVLPEIILGDSTLTREAVATPSMYAIPWFGIYCVGVITSLLLLGFKFKKFAAFLAFRKEGEYIIELPDTKEAFTFFNYIFIGKSIDPLSRKQIITHEQIHAKQGHTWDLIFFELLRVVFWFNPLVYLYQKYISIIHEYLADQKATAAISKKAYYEELLNTAFGTSNLSFTNTFFNKSLIKNRIIMLQKSKSRKSALIKYTLIIPLVLGMLTYVACSDDNTVVENESLEQQIAELKMAIEDKESLTSEELKQLQELREASVSEIKGSQLIEIVEQQRITQTNLENIPFAVIQEVPVFPGCEGLITNAERKDCMSSKIGKHVNSRFNTKLADGLGLSGVNRIFVSFKIDTNGNVKDLKSRAPHPILSEEVERIIATLPKMQPGKQKGKEVGVLYSLPITFKIVE